jgi:predicted MPP superfamily phosphohydrolase
MKKRKPIRITRRNFLWLAGCSIPFVCAADAFLIEPAWLAVRCVRIADDPTIRLLHFSDLHYKGNRSFLKKVVQRINSLSPDFACFTGDIVEDSKHLPQALDILSGIQSPLYGVPGNHDYWSGSSFPTISACFKATSGDWLVDRTATSADGRCLFEGVASLKSNIRPQTSEFGSAKRILLCHYPAIVKKLEGARYDILLAGHSHGGQVRLPFLGSLIVPYGVEGYDAGLYSTPVGPLYVNVGIGTLSLPVRFLCRPELTVIEI